MSRRRFFPLKGSAFGEPFFSRPLWGWFSESTELTDPPIKDWWRFPIQPEVSLNLTDRPDLCVHAGFFEDYRANNLEEGLAKYLEAMAISLSDCPLTYRFHFASESRPFKACAGAFLSQVKGPWVHDSPYFHEAETYDGEIETSTLFQLTSVDTGRGEWCEWECDERGTLSTQEYDYAPYLVVGGENEEQAEARWVELASYLRKTMEDLRNKCEKGKKE
jgi:hypothetical protein